MQVKDTFNSIALNRSVWSLVQGGSTTEGCSQIVTGMSFFFNGPGLRQAATVDLDLRNARYVYFYKLCDVIQFLISSSNIDKNIFVHFRFIQFYIQIGGESLKRGCGQPRLPEDVVILQYSVDAGKILVNGILFYLIMSCLTISITSLMKFTFNVRTHY